MDGDLLVSKHRVSLVYCRLGFVFKVPLCCSGGFGCVCFTESVKDIDWSFLQVKVDVLGHRERLAVPILPPRGPGEEDTHTQDIFSC